MNDNRSPIGVASLLEGNTWFQWATFTAKSLYPEGDCYVCASQSPKVLAIPLPFTLVAGIQEEEQKAGGRDPAAGWGGTGTARNFLSSYVSRARCVLEKGNAPYPNYSYDNRFAVDENNQKIFLPKEDHTQRKCQEMYPDITETDEEVLTQYRLDQHAEYECFRGHIVYNFRKDVYHSDWPAGSIYNWRTSRNNSYNPENRDWVQVGVFPGRCAFTWDRRDITGTSVWWSGRKGSPPFAGDPFHIEGNYSYFVHYRGTVSLTTPFADIHWACGSGYGLRKTLPRNFAGVCAWVRVIQATHILPMSKLEPTGRVKRALDRPTYEEVPAAAAAQDPALAGFLAAIPFFGAGYQASRNAKWINYVYYNQQRFMNWTHAALGRLDAKLQVLTESVEANTKMTLQNRMVLDWMLAKEGGVCAVVGETCCTYIPPATNATIDEAFNQAMTRLREIRDDAARNTGRDPDVTSGLATVANGFSSAWEWTKGRRGRYSVVQAAKDGEFPTTVVIPAGDPMTLILCAQAEGAMETRTEPWSHSRW
ncbi:hypothetical protein ACEWY4_003838 [Coilia grayii]|uniref:Uncharacterized protein n=1 Tax=Coilia grayii TaxID=363190 RepID=A0ABD1KSG3_9TELE